MSNNPIIPTIINRWLCCRLAAFALLIGLMGLASPLVVNSAEVSNIYQGKAEVLDQSHETRNMAIRKALQQVLSKLLAGTERLDADRVQKIFEQAPQLVQRFRSKNPLSTAYPKQLIVNFDPVALNSALAANGFHVWGTKRPDILLWLALEKPGNRQMFNSEMMPELNSAVFEAAENKGLPIFFPLMDLLDRQHLTVNDLWFGPDERIRQASRRYGVDYVLVGQLLLNRQKLWEGTWRFFQRNAVIEWKNPPANQFETVKQGLDRVFEEMISTNVLNARNRKDTRIQIMIRGITDFRDTRKIKRYLESLSLVSKVRWEEINRDRAIILLTMYGSKNDLEQALAADQILEAVTTDDSSELPGYRLIRQDPSSE